MQISGSDSGSDSDVNPSRAKVTKRKRIIHSSNDSDSDSSASSVGGVAASVPKPCSSAGPSSKSNYITLLAIW